MSADPRRRALLLAFAAAVAGLAAALLLVAAHLDLARGLLARACGGAGGGCDAVLASGWAYVPPILDQEELVPARTRGHVPAAALGAAYFTAVVLWLASLGAALRLPRLFLPLYVGVLLGCVASAGYLAVMAFRIGAFCPLCTTAHVANFALLGLLLLARPRAGDPAVEQASRRHVVTAAVLSLLGAVCVLLGALGLRVLHERDELSDRMAVIETQGELVELAHLADRTFTADDEARARFDAVLRPDDPEILPEEGAYGTLVYFSDLECPNCHRFELFLREELLPMFGGHLRVVFKHFPLEDLHEAALPAARALEAARLQGRFWELHALLIDRHDRLGEADWTALAVEAGCEARRFREDLGSGEVARRVDEDEALGRSIGVEATPTVFLDRRPVDGSVRTLAGFWRLRANALRRARSTLGQPW